MNFQETLESARYEVSIMLETDAGPYQIYKPAYPEAHAWEVYRNPNTDFEEELNGYDTLDEALKAVNAHALHVQNSLRDFHEAKRTICLTCMFPTDDACSECPVNKTYKSLLA